MGRKETGDHVNDIRDVAVRGDLNGEHHGVSVSSIIGSGSVLSPEGAGTPKNLTGDVADGALRGGGQRSHHTRRSRRSRLRGRERVGDGHRVLRR